MRQTWKMKDELIPPERIRTIQEVWVLARWGRKSKRRILYRL